jgi:hypothetical protein
MGRWRTGKPVPTFTRQRNEKSPPFWDSAGAKEPNDPARSFALLDFKAPDSTPEPSDQIYQLLFHPGKSEVV